MDKTFELFYERAHRNLKTIHQKLLNMPKARGDSADDEKKWLLEQLGESYRCEEIDLGFYKKIREKVQNLQFDNLEQQRERIKFINKMRKIN